MKKKEKEQWTAAAWDMLYLVQCGINSVVPDPERVAKMDLEKVYVRSKSQSLEALTYMALESLMKSNPKIRILDEKQVLPQWKEVKNKAIAKNLMMDTAREKLFAFMEEQGIWHVALKGAVLCHVYPKYGMRQMADNDILFDPSFRQEVCDWFIDQGYEVESYQISNHDEYHKKPIYNFEMHIALFKESEQPQLAQYYSTVKDRLVKKPEKTFEYCMTDEDFYLYIVAHEYKHYWHAGIGLRSLLDLLICNNARDNMNRSYLDEELNKMGIYGFEHEMRELALKVLSPEAVIENLSKKEQAILEELIFGCTYGTTQEYWNNRIRKLTSSENTVTGYVKFQYLIHRMVPDKTYMETWCQEYEPYFLQHRWLMPMAPFWRIIKRGIEKRKQLKEELDAVRKA